MRARAKKGVVAVLYTVLVCAVSIAVEDALRAARAPLRFRAVATTEPRYQQYEIVGRRVDPAWARYPSVCTVQDDKAGNTVRFLLTDRDEDIVSVGISPNDPDIRFITKDGGWWVMDLDGDSRYDAIWGSTEQAEAAVQLIPFEKSWVICRSLEPMRRVANGEDGARYELVDGSWRRVEDGTE